MVGWHPHLQSIIHQVGKRVEQNCNAAVNTSLYHSKSSLINGEFPCLRSLQGSFSTCYARPFYNCFQHMRLFVAHKDVGLPQVWPRRLPDHEFTNARFSRRNICSDPGDKLSRCCWNCNAVATSITPFLVCQSCRAVQPVDHSIDYFHIFSLKKRFDIDHENENLERKYKDWQKKLHPDLVHSKSKEEREYAAEQSARVIDAYHTLNDALARATYIMRLAGVEVDEEQIVSEPELLSEIMEIREAVEEAADPQALNEIKVQMQQKLSVWGQSFANAFKNKNYEEAQKSIQRMTYYKRVYEEIVRKL